MKNFIALIAAFVVSLFVSNCNAQFSAAEINNAPSLSSADMRRVIEWETKKDLQRQQELQKQWQQERARIREQWTESKMRHPYYWTYERKKLEAVLVGFVGNNAVLKQNGDKFLLRPVNKFNRGDVERMKIFTEAFPERNFQPKGKKPFSSKEVSDALAKLKELDAADNKQQP